MGTVLHIYDTTLRDGCQAEDISLTLDDKLRITERLDAFGIRYVEGGWPGSNPRDEAYFEAVRKLPLEQIRVAAFGSTRRAGTRANEDRNLDKLLRAETPVVTIFGKSWDLHVRDDLRIPEAENLEIIHDTVRYLKERVDEVIFDAEHFFDGYHHNPIYALECVKVAADGGADVLCLCDTNGGRLPDEIAAGVSAVREVVATPHRHPLPQRLRRRRGQQPGRGPATARCRYRVRSTGSASAAATSTFARSSPTCS